MARLQVAVVGVGHLGKEHARILAGMPEVELVGVADVNADQAEAVARRLGCRAYTSYRTLLRLAEAAVIAVPTTSHHAIAGEFLGCGIPVLVEKPLAATLEEAEALVELARRKRALLHHFGSARAVAQAGLGELERVAGISKTVAKKVHDHFHPDG